MHRSSCHYMQNTFRNQVRNNFAAHGLSVVVRFWRSGACFLRPPRQNARRAIVTDLYQGATILVEYPDDTTSGERGAGLLCTKDHYSVVVYIPLFSFELLDRLARSGRRRGQKRRKSAITT